MKTSQPTLFHNPVKRTPSAKPVAKKSSRTNGASPKPDGTTASTVKDGAAKTTAADDSIPLTKTDLPYQEFKLMSCDRHGWKYDVMKFDSRRPVDLNTWTKPVRLNRKELRRETATGENADANANAQKAVGPMLGLDGKPVVGIDGRVVMVDAEGRPIHNNLNTAPMGTSGVGAMKAQADKLADKLNPAPAPKGNKKKFQKKTRQVFLVPDHIRQLRREERHPWVIEDSSTPQKELWVGRMEEASKSETRALFMPAADNVFKFVPAHRWYKFQKRSTRGAISLDEAEKLMAQLQKQKDPEFWFLHKRNGQVSSATLATIRGHSVSSGSTLVHNTAGHSLGPGGRRLRTVDAGSRGLFDEDDEEGVDGEMKRKRERELGQEGDIDEMEYEEDFADDDEKPEQEAIDDEETKEIEERLKREYRNANKTREGYIDESEEEDEGEHLTGAGKAMKKLMRKVDKNYESDEDKNPYASSEEEDEEEEAQPEITQTQALQQERERLQKLQQQGQQGQSGTPSRAGSQAPPPSTRPSSKAPSRTGSPAPGAMGSPPPPPPVSGGMGGHSIVAKRATSPKAPAPKLKAKPGSRATSPLAGGGSTPTSPVPPSAGVGVIASNRAGGPPVVGAGGAMTPKAAGKRKADDSAAPSASSGQPKHKKRKPTHHHHHHPPSSSTATSTPITPQTELTEALLIQWLINTPNATTRDCIQYFQPCLTEDGKKTRFTQMVKELAYLKGGTLVLKAQYKDGTGGTPNGAPGAVKVEGT